MLTFEEQQDRYEEQQVLPINPGPQDNPAVPRELTQERSWVWWHH